ncbi:hypothetical protein TorRG33x02_087470, partial [Trema orientale]
MLSTSFVKISTDFAKPCSRSFSAIVAPSHTYLRRQRFVSLFRKQVHVENLNEAMNAHFSEGDRNTSV